MRQVLVKATGIVLMAFVILGIPEAVLRLFPSLIAVSVIDRMHPALRSELAARLDLPVEGDYAVIAPSERLDKGPDLYLMKPSRSYYRPVDPVDREVGAIDTIYSDARGFCNPDRLAKQTSFEIVTVGGSVPNCVSVDGEAEFSAQLQNLLQTPSYNLGVNGVGPYEYNEVLARYYDDLRPRIVIFAIGEANDLRDCRRYLDHLAGKTRNKDSKLGGPFRVSYFLAFMKASIASLAKEVLASTRPNFRYSVVSEGATIAMNVTNGDRDELKLAKEVRDGTLQPDLYAAPLKTFVNLAKKKGFVPVVLLVPAAYTLYQPSIAFEDPEIAKMMANYSDVQRQWLAGNADALGYEFLDPTVFMQKRAAEGPLLYFPSDIHLTAAGHTALAEAVEDRIRSSLEISKAAE